MENKTKTSETTKYTSSGYCETCEPWCVFCLGKEGLGFNTTRSNHNPDTQECPASLEEAQENGRENFRRSHHGFNEEDYEYEQIKLPEIPQAKHQGIREDTRLTRVTYKGTDLWAEAVGHTYWESLQAALKTLRWRVDLENKRNE